MSFHSGPLHATANVFCRGSKSRPHPNAIYRQLVGGLGELIWHTDDDGMGHPLDLNSTTGITLETTQGWYVFTNEREVTLNYPPVCDLDNPVIVEFHRVITPVLTPATIP